MKSMGPSQFLNSLPTEKIARAYPSGIYSKEADATAALALQEAAYLDGVEVALTGPTLSRYRSSIGLVNHRSPRKVAAMVSESPSVDQQEPQPPLPLVPRGSDLERPLWAIRDQLARIALALEAQGRSEDVGRRTEVDSLLARFGSDKLAAALLAHGQHGHEKVKGIKAIREQVPSTTLYEAKAIYEAVQALPAALVVAQPPAGNGQEKAS